MVVVMDNDKAESYCLICTLDGRDVVIAPRNKFREAIANGCLPFDVEEIQLITQHQIKLKSDSLIIVVKKVFSNAKLERIEWPKK